MNPLFDHDAPKRAASLSVNSDLLRKARALGINLSATLEQALHDKLVEERAAAWTDENRSAVQAYNRFVEENGCFGDEQRPF